MTFSLTSNFFANARGITFIDGGGLTWSFSKNTNAITATGTSGSTLSSVGLSDASTAPIYAISNSPLTANGTLDITLNTQGAAKVFAGPATGAAVQPTFRALVATDIPQIAYSSLSGIPAIPTAATPSASVGLTVVGGAATTFMRSDAAPALSVAIAPTWTGAHTFTPSNVAQTAVTINGGASASAGLVLNGGANQWAGITTGSATSAQSYGQLINAGTTSGDIAFLVRRQDGTVAYFNVKGDGSGTLGPSSSSGLSWTSAGAFTLSSTFAINGGTPMAQPTGYGTPVGTPVASITNASTLANVAQTLAALLIYLKSIGFIAA